MKTDRPVIVFAFDRALERPPLRMTLDAGVTRVHIVETDGIDDRLSNGLCDMGAARPMAALASDVPLRRRFGFDVVVSSPNGNRRTAGRSAAACCRPGRMEPTNPRPWERSMVARYGA